MEKKDPPTTNPSAGEKAELVAGKMTESATTGAKKMVVSSQ